jgi:hypothetical protein
MWAMFDNDEKPKTNWPKVIATTAAMLVIVLLVNLALVFYLFGYWSFFD